MECNKTDGSYTFIHHKTCGKKLISKKVSCCFHYLSLFVVVHEVFCWLVQSQLIH